MRRFFVLACLFPTAFLFAGCAADSFSKSVWNPFNLSARPMFMGGEPVRVGIAHGPADDDSVLNPVRWVTAKRTPWWLLQRRLSEELGRPVIVENLEPFQVAYHLESGRLAFAWMPAADYCELIKEGRFGRVIAISEGGTRRGLIVTSARTDVESLADLRGRRFAFGPASDPVLHHEAMAVLEKGGVSRDDLAKEVLPLPGTLQHHVDSAEVAKEVLYGLNLGGDTGTAAGVIEEQFYLRLPESGGRMLPWPTYSKDQFRVLARTEVVPIDTMADGPVLTSDKADPGLVGTVRTFLLASEKANPAVLGDLGLARFRKPPESSYACKAELHRLARDQQAAPVPD